MKTSKPRLLYILHAYHNRGGTEQHTKTLADSLAANYDTAILYPQGDKLVLNKSGQDTATYDAELPVWPITPKESPKTLAAAVKAVADFSPDLIHVQHFIYWPIGILDTLSDTKIPIAMSHHDYYAITPHFTMEHIAEPEQVFTVDYSMKIFKSDVSNYLAERRKIIQQSFARIPIHITPSDYLSRELGKIYPLSYRVIEHGIPEFKPLAKKQSSGPLRFGYTGALLPQKGWIPLVNAFKKIIAGGATAELHLYGGGLKPADGSIPGVFFHGAYDQSDIPEIMSQIDVGVIPSLFRESYNLVLSEMRLAGLPVATSRIGAIGDRVNDHRDGILFNPGDIEDICAKLSWFIENDAWHDWDIPKPRLLDEMLRDYDTLYRSMLEQS